MKILIEKRNQFIFNAYFQMGFSIEEIAEMENLSITTIKNKLKKYPEWEEKNKKSSSDRDLKIFEEYSNADQHSTLQDIGDKYGISRERVRQIIKNIDPNFKKVNTYSETINGILVTGENKKELQKNIRYAKKIYLNKLKIIKFWNSCISNDDGCWEWDGKRTPQGYGRYYLNIYGKKEIYSHRIAWILKYGEIPNNMFVLHKCDNPSCINPHHLKLGTQKDNVQDREERYGGTSPKDRKEKNFPKRHPKWLE